MGFKKLILYIILFGIIVTDVKCDDRIIGGIEAIPHSEPHAVHLDRNSNFFCGGSLIDKEWVVSAAHCYQSIFTVELGDHDQSIKEGTEQSIEPSNVFLHPRYSSATKDYDVMLIKLSSPATINEYVKPVDIPAAYIEPVVGEECRVCGWGNLQTSGNVYPNVLQCIDVNVVSMEECNEPTAYAGLITENMLCTYAPNGGKDACDGDSGGPVVCNGLLLGVVSWGYGCAYHNFPGVNSKLSWSVLWMQSIMNYN